GALLDLERPYQLWASRPSWYCVGFGDLPGGVGLSKKIEGLDGGDFVCRRRAKQRRQGLPAHYWPPAVPSKAMAKSSRAACSSARSVCSSCPLRRTAASWSNGAWASPRRLRAPLMVKPC